MPNLFDPEAPGERGVPAETLRVQEVPKVAAAAARHTASAGSTKTIFNRFGRDLQASTALCIGGSICYTSGDGAPPIHTASVECGSSAHAP